MTYYPTLEEDLARAKQILAKGRAEPIEGLPEGIEVADPGTIYGADTYAAYKLLESFVAEIARLTEEVTEHDHSFALYDKASMALMHAYKRAHPEVPENVWPDATVVNVWAAAEIERLQAENLRWQDVHTGLKLDYQNAEAELIALREQNRRLITERRAIRALVVCLQALEAEDAKAADVPQLVALYLALPEDDKKSTLQMLKTTVRAIERSKGVR